VCQVHTAIGSLVRSWWLSGRASAALIEDTARIIQHWQQRIAAARKCHIKRTRTILREMGIYGIGGGLSRFLFDEDGTVPNGTVGELPSALGAHLRLTLTGDFV
jgi:hypothetical protein